MAIKDELDGPSIAFGERAWDYLESRVERLAARLRSDRPLHMVRYVDRYLRNPFSILLLHRFLQGLQRYPGGITAATLLSVETTGLERNTPESPRLIFHDWHDAEDRQQVAKDWFRGSFPNFHWSERLTRELPHARELTLSWDNGESWSIRFDQGLGYWRTSRGGRPEFPFEADITRQISKLNSTNPLIEAMSREYPTYWYCGRQQSGF